MHRCFSIFFYSPEVDFILYCKSFQDNIGATKLEFQCVRMIHKIINMAIVQLKIAM